MRAVSDSREVFSSPWSNSSWESSPWARSQDDSLDESDSTESSASSQLAFHLGGGCQRPALVSGTNAADRPILQLPLHRSRTVPVSSGGRRPSTPGSGESQWAEHVRCHSPHLPRRALSKMHIATGTEEADDSGAASVSASNDVSTARRGIARHCRMKSSPGEVVGRRNETPRHGSSRRAPSAGGTVLIALDELTPHRHNSRLQTPTSAKPSRLSLDTNAIEEEETVQETCEPQHTLIEGFFVVGSPQLGKAVSEVHMCWPPSLYGSSLERAVVMNGFCPGPAAFFAPDPRGFGGEPFVFSLLETTLNPQGDMSGVLYGCVCGEQEKKELAVAPDGEKGEVSCDSRVFCLVSKIPIFTLLFHILRLLRRRPDSAAVLLSRLNSIGLSESLASDGIDLQDLDLDIEQDPDPRCRLQFPRPPLCAWHDLAADPNGKSPLGAVSRTRAQWQASWGLQAMFDRWENLIGDTLAKLLACILLEQKVLLLGDAPRVSTMALVLRALLWPFRWLHPYLSAPPPPTLITDAPLLAAPFPVVIALTQLPAEWGFQTHYDLPKEVVTGVLKHDYIHIHEKHATSGGLRGAQIKLPSGRHTAFLREVARAKQKLRRAEIDSEKAVQVVQDAAEAEVGKLADIIRRYAAFQVKEARAAQQHGDSETDEPGESDRRLQEFRERCWKLACDPQAFVNWFAEEEAAAAQTAVAGGTAAPASETVCFFRTFFETQLCLDFLNEEIVAQTMLGSPLAGGVTSMCS
eukprot:gnl/TRDRNA2_/TRDRNA2_167158_c1_seq1.p1 gnl/TRDRNA2_/TRDRNA2_167158_c1~~gnl/TRDRNA2_/TRDRNA2_167158_c1_seq1.p1  ORF type:complete len:748 (+),score=94.32 gnl/TRDRNA2_/TRDRNA2_167158_c1_seq1:2-2245(+)